ncbi:MAG: flagellar biosynthesis repressor FlbT [Alphaproteobacteria bacterium]|nr:flagellar biosynthesis repressor FlbT [Alphaproteobacteria bacterium]MBU0797007.1 flagellar biosynthesis repressor FlbT [Alphaproteobacteria bacterium]MBU0886586.1 flagellar biosynthesis repressor FlbT [Alphaproteobacteria bacterium]MBU1814175.1 flagellar biosynthesis repressor FlbT [Alphaproteobacteria bacterium]
MALKINVKPGEKIVINGAVITMGEGASYIVLQNQATFLREKDIMQQEDATTPVRRIYFSLMLMYLDQDNYQNYYNDYMDRMIELMRSTGLAQIRDTLMVMFRDVQERRFFQALKACKALMKFEEELLKENPAGPAGERVFTLADNKA